jgi:ferric-dicitrate binding protein FerR (iron transport regulator)
MSTNNRQRLDYLLRQYAAGAITDKEVTELSIFLGQSQLKEDIREILEVMAYEAQPVENYDSEKVDKMIDRILKSVFENAKIVPVRGRSLFTKVSVAAAILICVLTGAYFIKQRLEEKPAVAQKTQNRSIEKDIAPGGNKASLTLADGSVIILDSTARGKLAKYGNVKVLKIEAGKLSYQQANASRQLTIQYNTISTPRGGQYQVVLPDGSKVWLNAASSLKFPTAFLGKERNVELSGEAYFEVAHNEKQPFKVKVKGVEVLVLGTHFNINSYDDEGTIKTTLLKGSVRETIADKQQSVTITPGQQAQVGKDKMIKVINDVDIAQVIAWQSGLFEFNNSDLPTIMRQISRWYDVDVVYESKPADAKFGGGISKNLPLSEVLQLLQANGVKFQLEGRVLKVIP